MKNLLHRNVSAFLSADHGGGTGGESTPKTPSTLKEALSALASAREAHSTAMAEVSARAEKAEGEAAAAIAERDTLKAQFDSATAAATEHQEALVAVRSELDAEKLARSGAEEKATKAEENSSRLEKLCGVHGIDPAKAVASGEPEPGAQGSARESLLAQYAGLKDPSARAAFYAKHKSALLD